MIRKYNSDHIMAAHQFVPFVFLATPEVSAALSLEYMAKSSHA